MTYCEMVTFTDGKPDDAFRGKNSWLGAALIWTSLYDQYLKDPDKEYDCWLTCGADKGPHAFWDLAKRRDLPLFERAVHAAMFNRAIVRREHFPLFAEHLREFVARWFKPGQPNHLQAWAKVIDTCKAEALGFYNNSIVESPWFVYPSQEDDADPDAEGDPRPYDLNIDTDHFEVYDWLAEIDAPADTPA